ncbi:MAG: MIP/aquaporin family protein [Caulobacteraceae bacterium]
MSVFKRLAAEGLGTAWLLVAVVGSGIMADRLSAGNEAVALLANAVATGAALYVLVTILGPVSGAHFNPAVSLVMALRRSETWRAMLAYAVVQATGAVLGVWAAHAMFGEAIWQVSSRARDGAGMAFAEFIAAFGLVTTIIGAMRFKPSAVPAAVALYITGAYWFTASTSFANPAVTLARALTDTFAGIAPASAPAFIVAQIGGAVAAALLGRWLFGDASSEP